MKKIYLSVALIALLLAGCSGEKDTADPLTKASQQSVKVERADEKYVRQLLKEAQKQVAENNLTRALALYNQALAHDPNIKHDIAENKASVELLRQVEQLEKAGNYQQIKEILAGNKLRKNNKLVAHEKLTASYQQALEQLKKEEHDPADQAAQPAENLLWNAQKSLALSQFMADWGTTMHQQYNEISPDKNGHFYGVALPQDLLTKVYLDGEKTEVVWRNQVTRKTRGTSLVGAYSDAETGTPHQKHLYFFMIQNGEPQIYVTRLSKAKMNDPFEFKKTKSQALKNGFETILNGQSVTLPSASQGTPAETTTTNSAVLP